MNSAASREGRGFCLHALPLVSLVIPTLSEVEGEAAHPLPADSRFLNGLTPFRNDKSLRDVSNRWLCRMSQPACAKRRFGATIDLRSGIIPAHHEV